MWRREDFRERRPTGCEAERAQFQSRAGLPVGAVYAGGGAAAAARPDVYNTGSDSYEERGLYDRCITRGIPGSMMPAIYGNAYEIVQRPGWVGIEYEMIHEARVIPLDGRPHASKEIKMLMGDPRGHWEGNTLVVETTNFDPRAAYRGASENLKLVERFTRIAPDQIEWAVTVDDPHTWTRPWTFAMNLSKKDDSQRLRVCLPRGQLRTAEHPERGASGRKGGGEERRPDGCAPTGTARRRPRRPGCACRGAVTRGDERPVEKLTRGRAAAAGTAAPLTCLASSASVRRLFPLRGRTRRPARYRARCSGSAARSKAWCRPSDRPR
jgi:hypothetical protein